MLLKVDTHSVFLKEKGLTVYCSAARITGTEKVLLYFKIIDHLNLDSQRSLNLNIENRVKQMKDSGRNGGIVPSVCLEATSGEVE